MENKDFDKRFNNIKELIVKSLFELKKPFISEVTIKNELDASNLNIKAVINSINNEKKYPTIDYYYNSFGVLVIILKQK